MYFLRNFRLRVVRARAVNTHDVLVEQADLNHHACLVPFSGVWSGLVLDLYMVANCQGWESLGVFRPSLGSFHVAVSEGFLSRR